MNGAHLASPIKGELGYAHWPQLGSQIHCPIGNQIWGPLGKEDVCPNFALTVGTFVCSNSGNFIGQRQIRQSPYDFLNNNNILYDRQFGFRKNYSTNLALIEVIDKTTKTMDDRGCTLGVFLDLSKAFDTIDYNILFDKLQHYGIRGLALEWFKSYLTDRYQQVSYAGVVSSSLPLHLGVPQGSILGPLLFLIYINDIINCSSILQLVLFADDTSAFIIGLNYVDLFQIMNEALSKLSRWFQVNKLSLNITKSNYMIFKSKKSHNLDFSNLNLLIDNTQLARVSKVKFLGVIIDEHLTWKPHIEHVKSKVTKIVGVMYRLKGSLPKHSLRLLYTALLSPYLHYCTVVWAGGHLNTLKTIHVLQKRAIRIICGAHYLAESAPLFKSLGLLKIHDSYKFQLAILMYQHYTGTLPHLFKAYFVTHVETHSYNTRHKLNYRYEVARTNVRYFSVKIAGPKLWNSISASIRDSRSQTTFTNAYKSFLLDLY